MPVDPNAPLTDETRDKLIRMSRQMQRQCEPDLHSVIRLRRQAGTKLPAEYQQISNAYEFVLLLNFDLAALLEDALSAESDLRANLHFRVLLLTVYESARSLRQILDHRFRAAVANIAPNVDIEDDLKQAHSRVKKLFTVCEGEFRDVRNGLLGHRDLDAETRIQLLEKTDAQRVADLAIELLAAISLVSRALLLIMQAVAQHINVAPPHTAA
jgi:hypothetical protein